jgi:ornithine carbamoyltransferase
LTAVKPGASRCLTLIAVTPSIPRPPAALAAGQVPGAASAQELVDAATRLKAAWRAGMAGRPLLGKNLAVLQPAGDSTTVSPLHRAAADLGARVAQVSLGEPPPADSEFPHIARMLGKMYDAIDAGTTTLRAAAELERHAGVPVYRGLGDSTHPALALAGRMDPSLTGAGDAAELDDNRRFLLQALLLRTIG